MLRSLALQLREALFLQSIPLSLIQRPNAHFALHENYAVAVVIYETITQMYLATIYLINTINVNAALK